jgi:hypothetical protein
VPADEVDAHDDVAGLDPGLICGSFVLYRDDPCTLLGQTVGVAVSSDA